MEYCGLDMGKKSSHFCFVDEQRKVLQRGVVKNSMQDMKKVFAKRESCRIVIEASTKAFWMADLLESLGHEPIVVDPGRTKAIGAARIKNDKLDARVLAELCAANLLAKIDRPSKEQREERMILVTRDGLVKSRSKLVMTVRSLLDSEGIEIKKCATTAFVDVVMPIVSELSEKMSTAIYPVLKAINTLTEQIYECDKQLEMTMKNDEDVKRLMTVPGVGIISAICFLSTIRNAGRFESGRQAGAYLGLVPSLYQSGQTFVRGRITKCGNSQTRWILCIAANALLRTRRASVLRDWGANLAKRIGRKKAIVAIARKLALIMWSMLKNKTDFDYQLSNRQVVVSG